MFDGVGNPLDDHLDELDHELRVSVGCRELNIPDRCRQDVKLLTKLSTYSLGDGFSLMQLAARKLPKTTMPFVFGPLAHQPSVISADDGCDDAASCHLRDI